MSFEIIDFHTHPFIESANNICNYQDVCDMSAEITKQEMIKLEFFQALLPLLGALLGDAFSSVMSKADHWIAFALLFIIGLKMIMDGRNFKLKEKIFDVSSLKVIILLSLATSIDAFIVGISFSMMWTIMQQVIAILAIFIATFLFSFMGVKMGEKVHFIKPRIALFLGGAILILIGVKTLIEHLYF